MLRAGGQSGFAHHPSAQIDKKVRIWGVDTGGILTIISGESVLYGTPVYGFIDPLYNLHGANNDGREWAHGLPVTFPIPWDQHHWYDRIPLAAVVMHLFARPQVLDAVHARFCTATLRVQRPCRAELIIAPCILAEL
jgi:hypothetical protein